MGNRTGVIIAVLVILGVVGYLMVRATIGLAAVTGEVCIDYNGRSECRVASGQTREDVLRAAADMACSAMASGMTQRINCQQTVPSRVTWR